MMALFNVKLSIIALCVSVYWGLMWNVVLVMNWIKRLENINIQISKASQVLA